MIFGVGHQCNIFATDGVNKVAVSTPPYDGSVEANQYSRYLAVYNIGSDAAPFAKAQLAGFMDAQGRCINMLKRAIDQ